jgi:DNA-binding GntR family transcriptional regulator
MIVSGQLKPGDHVRQDELAHQIGMTRVPVREAFRSLTAEGVLVHHRNRGHFVATISGEELRQLLWIRVTMEDEVVRTTRWPDATGVAHLRALNAEVAAYSTGATPYDYVGVMRADREFHFATWELSPLTILRRELIRMWRLTEPYHLFMPLSRPESLHRSVAEHDALIDAVETGDRESYHRRVVRHRQVAWDAVAELTADEAGGDPGPS